MTAPPVDRCALELSRDDLRINRVAVHARVVEQAEIHVHRVVHEPQRVVDEPRMAAVQTHDLADHQAHVRPDKQAPRTRIAHRLFVQADGSLQREHIFVAMVSGEHAIRRRTRGGLVGDLQGGELVVELDKQARHMAAHVDDLRELLGVALPRARVSAQDAIHLTDVLVGAKP